MNPDPTDQKVAKRRDRLDRMRQPDNLPTWSVIVGCLLAVVFILGASYSLSGLAQTLVFLATVVYIGLLQLGARVNVFRILWGGTIARDEQVNRPLVIRATISMALLALVWLGWDQFADISWGLFSWIGAAIALIYLSFVLRASHDTSENRE